ncbi:hypothetical protein [Bradyrhizobium cosmicum]|uniref:hypothetical protein n=1 Tax=Bradyrhizobium cosmicum TaxID=1404864 RepID=UPI0028E3CF28|nr:hypothetical protein [Bradyrhizobium cosmicum]
MTTFPLMHDDCDPERETLTAMKFALAADGLERQRLVRLAMAWQEIARIHPTSGRSEKAA